MWTINGYWLKLIKKISLSFCSKCWSIFRFQNYQVLIFFGFGFKAHVYSRVPNKRTGRLLENEKKSHLYALIWNYTFINFQQKVPPICLFPPTLESGIDVGPTVINSAFFSRPYVLIKGQTYCRVRNRSRSRNKRRAWKIWQKW